MTLELPSAAVLLAGAAVCSLVALVALVASLVAGARRMERERRAHQLDSVYKALT